MNTITDLRRSLEETVQRHDAPDPHELLSAVQEDVATGQDRGHRGRRLVAAAAAAALVAAGGWALSRGPGSDEETHSPQPADPSWELVDGAPPQYAGGLALVDSVEVTPDSFERLTWQGADANGFVVAWCEYTGEFAGGQQPTAMITVMPEPGEVGDRGAIPGCLGGPDNGLGGPGHDNTGPQEVPDLHAGQVLGTSAFVAPECHLTRSCDPEAPDEPEIDYRIIVGLYREVPVSEFPYPDQQDIPPAPAHEVVVDSATPLTSVPADSTDGARLPAVTVESHAGARLTAWAGEPGRLQITVNGTVITDDGEVGTSPNPPPGSGPEDTRPRADSDLRAGYWHTWAGGASSRTYDLSPGGLAPLGILVHEGDELLVSASADFPRDAWQVGIDGAAPQEPEQGLVTVGPTRLLPASTDGLEQITAVRVPADGSAHLLDLGDVDTSEVVWVINCAPDMRLTEVRIGGATTQCTDGLEWQTATRVEDLPDGPVRLSVGTGTQPVVVAAYRPVAEEDPPAG